MLADFIARFTAAYIVDKAGVSQQVDFRDHLGDSLLTGETTPVMVAPTVTTQPSITGNATTGSVLTLNEGAASGTPAPTSAIQWLRGTTAISGATGATYTLVSGDVGQAISARVTWTNSAGSVSATSNAIPGQAPAPTISFATQPTALRVYQRATDTGGEYGKGAAEIPVTVTTDSPVQSLEYRLRDADQPATTLVGWAAAAGAGAAGERTIAIVAPARLGDYLLDVRANADPATVISSPNRFGVGAVILFAGQSQAVRTLGSFPAQPAGGFAAKGLVASPYGRVFGSYVDTQRDSPAPAWAVPAEGTFWDSLFLPEFINQEQSRRGVSCAYVGHAEGATIVSEWTPGTTRHTKLVEVLGAVGGFEAFYWHQGGSDVSGGTAAASYEADLDSILDDLSTRNSRAFDMVITAFGSRTSGTWADVQRIRRAAKAVADRRANAIYAEPRLVALADNVHQTPDGNIALARHLSSHFAAIETGSKAVGPTLASAAAAGANLTLNFTLASGANLSAGGAWHTRIGVYPAGTTTGRITVSSGTVQGSTATLALASDPGGPVDAYVYDHPDPSGTGPETAYLTDDSGRQAVPSTAAPVAATYQAGTGPSPSYPALSVAAGTPSYTAGKFGQAMDCNGTFYARAAKALSPTTPEWGAESWVKLGTVTGANIAWGEEASSAYFVVRSPSGSNSPAGLACVSYKGVSAAVHLYGGPRIDDNAWHHVAVQFRSDGADLFVDGVLVASNQLPIDSTRVRTKKWTVGMFDGNTAFPWSGQVDEHLIWDGLRYTASFTPRTTAYDALPAGTVAYWAFEDNLTGGLPA